MTRPGAKVERTADGWAFWCEGCGYFHDVDGRWQFNGDEERPTFTPSVNYGPNTKAKCHFWVRDGRIEYLSDSHHRLAGKTVDMKPIIAARAEVWAESNRQADEADYHRQETGGSEEER